MTWQKTISTSISPEISVHQKPHKPSQSIKCGYVKRSPTFGGEVVCHLSSLGSIRSFPTSWFLVPNIRGCLKVASNENPSHNMLVNDLFGAILPGFKKKTCYLTSLKGMGFLGPLVWCLKTLHPHLSQTKTENACRHIAGDQQGCWPRTQTNLSSTSFQLRSSIGYTSQI